MGAEKKHSWLGGLLFLLGVLLLLMATGVIPVDDEDLHAPNAILILCAIVFLAGGVVVAFPADKRLKMSMVVLILISFMITGSWAALFGEDRHISGGIPFVSRETNVLLARIGFGAGALMVFGILLLALKDLIRAFADHGDMPSEPSDPKP